MKEFKFDKSTKDMIADISSLFGVKSEVVKQVWEYTLFTWFLKLSKDPEHVTSIKIPYLGNVGIKLDSETLDEETGKLKSNVTSFIALDEEFKQMYGNICAQSESELAEYIQEHYIKNIVEDIQES